MTTLNMQSVRTGEKGFSLVEVLVALLVLSLGLLGLAALQTTGLKFNHQSYERTQAVMQIYDIIDRMRANKSSGVINSTYDNVTLGASPGTTDCNSAPCDVTQLAEFDIRQWNATNASVLAQGQGSICRGTFCSSSPPASTVYRIVIRWREDAIDKEMEVETQP